LSSAAVHDAITILEPYINEERLDRVRTVLSQRTKNCKFLFENPNNPSNVWACLRTIDSFGIQDVDVIIASGMYQGKQALSTKRGMRTAMGSAQW
jgi:tRNA G18 (ribose-2'-O)-methylase SpoU